MSAKHTPAPWTVEDPMGPETLSIVAHADKPTYEWQILASVHCDDEEDGETKYPLSPEVCAANACLIAAAPELLKTGKDLLALAVRLLAKFDYPNAADEKIICDAAAIHAKAEGEA